MSDSDSISIWFSKVWTLVLKYVQIGKSRTSSRLDCPPNSVIDDEKIFSNFFLLTFVIFRFLDPINDFFPNLLFSTARSRLVQGSTDRSDSFFLDRRSSNESGISCPWISSLFIIPILHIIIKMSGIRKQTTHLRLVFTTNQSEFSIDRTIRFENLP